MSVETEVQWKQTDMVEVVLGEPDDFLKVRETLTRIGVASRKEKKIYQSCHILHKQGKYYICLLYTSPSPRDRQKSRMPSSA